MHRIVWMTCFVGSVAFWAALLWMVVGCAGRFTNTLEWGEQLSGGGIEMKITSENKEEVTKGVQ